MLKHLDHVVEVAGIDHEAIGPDFAGGGGVTSFKNGPDWPYLTLALLKPGYTEQNVRKILGGNFLRFFRQVLQCCEPVHPDPGPSLVVTRGPTRLR
jgi:membrane dipeptidase